MNVKYAVFKVRENEMGPDEPMEMIAEVKDFFVIRLQDVFAAPGLYAYANVIQTWIDRDIMEGKPIPPDLEGLRDYVADLAMKAEQYPVKKLPD